MITVAEAEAQIQAHRLNLSTETISLSEATSRLLAEDLTADRDFPPFDRVTMDGIAVNRQQNIHQDLYAIEGVVAAGQATATLQSKENGLEVMTGAVLPNGTDTVIPYEHLEKSSEGYKLLQTATLGQNIHRQGSDRQQGSIIVKPGTLLRAPEIGIAATVGKSVIKVQSLPKVAIISTGDELVAVDESPLPHQIRSSNAATMAHALTNWKVQANQYHINDDLQGTINRLEELLHHYDVLILSGGVSKGKFDHVPPALETLGVQRCFHKITQRPGKPFWFGYHQQGGKVFAFPGNPVSSFMCFNRYFKPWFSQQLGYPVQELWAQLGEDVQFAPDLTYFAQVRLESQQNGTVAWPVEGHGSGDLANLVDADAFIELPRGKNVYPAGQVYRIYPYRD